MFSKAKILEYLYYSIIIGVGLVGVGTYSWYNALPTNGIFEAMLFGFTPIIVRSPSKTIAPFLLCAVAYLSVKIFLMLEYNPSNYLDFAQAYKAFIYIVPLCFFVKRRVFQIEKLLVFCKILLALFFIKYSYSLLLNLSHRMGSRPGLFAENNFELVFLISLVYVLFQHFGKEANKWFALLSLIVVMSGSRSSLLALLVAYVGLYIKKMSIKTFLSLFVFAFLSFIVTAIFVSRLEGGSVESIDRFKFMLVFLDEVSDWPAWKFLVGSFPITPLSEESCKVLSFYIRLFSYAEDGSCYSVVLHSYFFRVIFDHGLIGLVFLVSFIHTSLKANGHSNRTSLFILGIFAASALSVSAMNSIYTSIFLAIAFSMYSKGEAKNFISPTKYHALNLKSV